MPGSYSAIYGENHKVGLICGGGSSLEHTTNHRDSSRSLRLRRRTRRCGGRSRRAAGAGLDRRLRRLGHIPEILPPVPLPDGVQREFRAAWGTNYWGRVLRMAGELADETAALDASGKFPLLLGGDHSIAIGSIAGLARKHSRLGVLWIDAHSDLNTPDTSPSGNAHGMSLAASLGLGDLSFAFVGGFMPKLQPERIALVGARSLDEGERETIRRLGIACYPMHEIDKRGHGCRHEGRDERRLERLRRHPSQLRHRQRRSRRGSRNRNACPRRPLVSGSPSRDGNAA